MVVVIDEEQITRSHMPLAISSPSGRVALVGTARIGSGGSKIVGSGRRRSGSFTGRIPGRQKGAGRETIKAQKTANQVAQCATATV